MTSLVLLLACFAGFTVFDASCQSQRVRLGSFRTIIHQVSGQLFAIDEKTILIENFQFDGAGGVVVLYVFRRDQPTVGITVDWSLFGSAIPSRRFNEDVIISLLNRPNDDDLLVSDLVSITIWCSPVDVYFGRLDNIPVITQSLAPGSQILYCIQLHENLQVTIGYNDDTIRIRQCGCIDEDQYMAFGISGNDTKTYMVGADVVVTWIDDDGPNAIDYYLTDRQQCRGGEGVCPDTLLASGDGIQDASVVLGDVLNGRRCVEYSRLLSTSDRHDRDFLTNGESQFLAWAYGPRSEEALGNLAFFHTEYPRNGENFMLDFSAGRSSGLRCTSELTCSSGQQCPGWTGSTITAMENTTFRVTIGTSGGIRGYQSITGLSGWGIAYHINDTLVPVLKLRRNVTYTFIIEAGNDRADSPRYHPFYITDSIDGGIFLDTPADRARKNEKVFAGYNLDTNEPTAAGRYCDRVETTSSAPVSTDCSSELQEYESTLTESCQGDASEAAILTWTPDNDTPNVVYYQCANHVHLGWEIHIEPRITAEGGSGGSLVQTSLWLLVTITLFAVLAVHV